MRSRTKKMHKRRKIETKKSGNKIHTKINISRR